MRFGGAVNSKEDGYRFEHTGRSCWSVTADYIKRVRCMIEEDPRSILHDHHHTKKVCSRCVPYAESFTKDRTSKNRVGNVRNIK